MDCDFSIIIPTFNRIDTLPEVLAAVDRQESEGKFEIIVVDDGSTDGTSDFLDSWTARAASNRVVSQPNQGPAAARNKGIAEARGRWVAFLGDDTVPEPGWLNAHHRAHESRQSRQPIAVLGHTDWHPRVPLTPFLRYINDHGLQFGYALIEDPESVPFNFFYTSNVSLSRKLLDLEPMDTGFPYPAWEDIELSYRLKSRGLTLVYEPAARVLHDHPTDFRRFMDRQEKAGFCAVVFYRRHPELGPFLGIGETGPPDLPSRPAQRLREMLVRTLQRLPMTTPGLWEETLRYHYIRGLRRGWKETTSS
jgi:glycosyltransferase involved in cell wall biosynthesis